jgi:hypothetical protein
MTKTRLIRGGAVLFLILFTVCLEGTGWCALDPEPARTAAFFSQGQAAYDAQDSSKSRQEAVQDFLGQAIVQAIGTFLSPSEMGSKYGLIQERFLKNPGKYVQTYQLFSAGPANGLYQVRGQVTVAVEELKKDLSGSGLIGGKAATGAPTALPPQPTQPPAVSSEESRSDQARIGKTGGKQPILWAVAEKWGPRWYIPESWQDPHGIFAASAFQDTSDYNWQPRLPEAGSITVDDEGNIQISQVASSARALGIKKAAVGYVVLRNGQTQQPVLEATIRILDIASGQYQGEFHKELTLQEGGEHEGAMELSGLIVPQLDRLIGNRTLSSEPVRESRPSEGAESTEARPITQGSQTTSDAEQTTGTPGFEPVKGAGEWVLVLHSAQGYAYWEELEKILHDHFKSMRVTRLDFGPDTATVKLDGVDGQFISSLNGTVLHGGAQLRIDNFSQDKHSLDISFIASQTPKSE